MTHDLLSALPTSIVGLIALMILAVAPIATASIPILLHRQTRQKAADNNGVLDRKLDGVQSSLDDVNYQVKNGRKTNLRDDLAEGIRMMQVVRASVEKLQEEHLRAIHAQLADIAKDLGRIRDEIGEERTARRHEIGDERIARKELEGLVRLHHPEMPGGA